MQQLSKSYDYCHELTQRTAHNFRFSFMTLPEDKRSAMDALYAFNRITDDFGDDDSVPLALRKARLKSWRESLRFVLDYKDEPEQPDTAVVGTFWDHPALPAIADMAVRNQV